MAYATTADVKAYLGIESATRADDALLAALLARAQAAIDTHTRRTFEAAADTTRAHGWELVDGAMLFLDGDLCVVTSVVNGDGATLQPAQYTVHPRNRAPYYAIQLRPSAGATWDAATGDIAVTGRWAYSVTPPADVVHATVRLCAWMYRQKDNTGNDQPMIAGNVTILPARLPADVLELLSPYVRLLL